MSPVKKLSIITALFLVSLLGIVIILEKNPIYINQENFPEVKGAYTVNTEVYKYKITRVIDGDTIELENGEVVRYIGINTPETYGKKECYGKEAKEYNIELVENKNVRIEKDKSERDKFGRLLRYVYVWNGEKEIFVNADLVEKGFAEAIAYKPDTSRHTYLENLEREAKKEDIGIWKYCRLNN